jgi:large conductance mechanosensitive channel
MGADFGSIVKTFTDGIIMPVIGAITGGIDFKDKVINLGDMPVVTPEQIAAAQAAKEPTIMYRQFLNGVITFLIVALVMFALPRYALRLFNTFQTAPIPLAGEEVSLAEIGDLLKNR